jgi:hypothetical protein
MIRTDFGISNKPTSDPRTMKTLYRLRPYLRCLSARQRRSWFEQHKRLTPRVPIGTACVPPGVRRQYAYVAL